MSGIHLAILPLKELGYISDQLRFREPLFIIFGFLFISIIASSYFAHLGQKSKAIIDLLIPASTFEKFLAGFFFTSILSVLAFLLIFTVTDWAFITYIKSYFRTGDLKELAEVKTFFSKNEIGTFAPLYVMPFTVTSVFLLGSAYFNRFHYIKTAICVMLFSGAWTYIVMNVVDVLLSGKTSINLGNNGKETIEWLLFAIIAVCTLVVLSITYVRLKEKEV
ncbi:MAG: hypothetical protein EOO96_24150 [Pedobacter sp.]|nr:MAG: hypothetical protein EOO96_24150 [Pedobacter sp.]